MTEDQIKDAPTPGVRSPRQEHANRINAKLRRELGPLVCDLLEDPKVLEIMLNPDGKLWVDRHGEQMKVVGEMPASQAESLMGTVASILKTQITALNPILECELPLDGSRFEALLPPLVAAPTFTIRRKASSIFTLDQYVESGIMTAVQAETLKAAIANKKNILIVGGTSSGKTTLTNAIIDYMPICSPFDRIVIIEDTGELQCSAKNVVALRAVDYVDMTRLLKATLRLRPDRILVGEVRDGAALALLKAWNTGHPGGAATVHANSGYGGLVRLEQLVSEATGAPMQKLIAEAVDYVVMIEKTESSRRIKEIIEVTGHDGSNYLTNKL